MSMSKSEVCEKFKEIMRERFDRTTNYEWVEGFLAGKGVIFNHRGQVGLFHLFRKHRLIHYKDPRNDNLARWLGVNLLPLGARVLEVPITDMMYISLGNKPNRPENEGSPIGKVIWVQAE